MAEQFEHMLKSHGLRVTLPRKEVLKIFDKYEKALSYQELKTELPQEFDRVTIYRTLKSFEEKGLIHTVSDLNGEINYAICQHDEHDHCKALNHMHGHFKCKLCDELTCLEEQSITEPTVPKGSIIESIHVLIQGTCQKCS